MPNAALLLYTSFMLLCSNLTKRYNAKTKNAVDDLSLSIESGQIFGFLGPNGAGKSTTIRMIVGLLSPDKGKISFDDYSLSDNPKAYKRLISYVPDVSHFYDRMTASEHLSFIADLYEIDDKQRKDRIHSLAERLMLSHALSDEISSFSHGMKQKLSVISALLTEPRLFILDEPMVGLDPKASYILKQMLVEYASKGNTVFFSTHVLEVAQQLCTTLGIIHEGKLLFNGSFSELQARNKESNQNLEQLFLQLTQEETHDGF